MVEYILGLLGITDPDYIEYGYKIAMVLIPLSVILVWDAICCIFRSFTRFK